MTFILANKNSGRITKHVAKISRQKFETKMFITKSVHLLCLGQLRQRAAINFAQTRLASLYFSKKHEWVSVGDNKSAKVGISQHAQEALGDVVYVQLPEVGSNPNQFDEVGAIESVKAASELLTPVSGKITEINKKLEEKPSLVNSDCHGDGWMFQIELKDPSEVDKLMNEEQYNKYLEETKE